MALEDLFLESDVVEIAAKHDRIAAEHEAAEARKRQWLGDMWSEWEESELDFKQGE